MTEPDAFALIRTSDQWMRSTHENTALDRAEGVVQLAWEEETAADGTPGEPPVSAGLALDPWCRLYRALPEAGRVETLAWSDRRRPGRARRLFEDPAAPPAEPGAFRTAGPPPAPLATPRGLAADASGRLFVAESGSGRIFVLDLLERRLLAVHTLPGRPADLATDGTRVAAVVLSDTGPALFALSATGSPAPLSLPEVVDAPGPLAFDAEGRLHVIDAPGKAEARVVPLDRPGEAFSVPHASGLVFARDPASGQETVVVARAPGADFLRFRLAPGARSSLPHLNANGYDGRGIAPGPKGEVVFWTAHGLGTATLARVRYRPEGRVVTFRLDSGAFGTRWGRVFLDACIPSGTEVRLGCLTADEPPEEPPAPLSPPENAGLATVHRPDLSPPLPPASLLAAAGPAQRLHRRATGSERPWTCPDDSFATYEAPVIAPPGRYLWLALELRGRTRATPRVRALRAEYPAPDLLRRLPRVFSADREAADFLHRYLVMAESDLSALDTLAGLRHVLLKPRATPAGMLGWLGGMLGLEIDDRWSERATREIVENAIWLFRRRGTVAGLKRFVEIYLGRDVVLVEHFRLRGLGGAFLGEAAAETANSVLGAGFRIGGRIGTEAPGPEAAPAFEDAIAAHAHRFTLLVPVLLDAETRAVVEHILEVHRPAHTVVDICSVDAGMRAGIGLHLGLSSLVGATSGFGTLQAGGSVLGRRDVVGRPGMAGHVGAARLGRDARAG